MVGGFFLVVGEGIHYFRALEEGEGLWILRISGCSSVGRVHVWGACGRTFESCHPDVIEGRLLGNREPFLVASGEWRVASGVGNSHSHSVSDSLSFLTAE